MKRKSLKMLLAVTISLLLGFLPTSAIALDILKSVTAPFGIWHHSIERCDFQARLGDDCVRQIVGHSHAVDHGESLFQQ